MVRSKESGWPLNGSPSDEENMFFVPERGFVLRFWSNHSFIE
ncbi:hypothetical protein [Mesotoga sp. B105.6.4]|nr:hypothetical protein [Mesotoga sp. B105.6.4]